MKLILELILISVSLGLIACDQLPPTDSVPDVTVQEEKHSILSGDEIRIYETLIPDPYREFIVVDDSILGHFVELENERLREIIPGLQSDTLRDFIWRNRPSRPPVHYPYEDEMAFLTPPDIEKMNPKPHHYLIFSRIGFSTDQRQALVYQAETCIPLCGRNAYYLLRRTNDGWQIEIESETFRS